MDVKKKPNKKQKMSLDAISLQKELEYKNLTTKLYKRLLIAFTFFFIIFVIYTLKKK